MANSPGLRRGLALFAGTGNFELLHVDIVLAKQFPKCSSLFLGRFRSLRDVSLVSDEKTLQIVCFELRDDSRLHFTERQLGHIVVRT